MKREYGVVEVKYYRVMVNGKTHLYTRFVEIDDGYAKVMKNDRWGVIDNKGNMVCPMAFRSIGDLACGVMTIYDGYLYGYFSKETGTILPCIYERAYPFEGECARVVYKGEIRYINKNGEFIN